MASKNTIYMTPDESKRVQNVVQDLIKKRNDQKGRLRESSDPQTLIQQATSVSLMQDLSQVALGLTSSMEKETMSAYAIGEAYPPCTTKVEDLERMSLSDLRMETHHRGHVLFLRRISPVAELKTLSWAVVQSGSDEAERIEVFLHKTKYGVDTLDLCSEFLVKEPYYTLNNHGEPTIRVDHPSDIAIVSIRDSTEAWRNRQTEKSPLVKAPSLLKEEGNAALQKEDFARAYVSYTAGLRLISEGVKTDETLRRDLHRNRSHVNLALHRYDEAIIDAHSSLIGGDDAAANSLDAKAHYRAGLALYALGTFSAAKESFEKQERLQPGNEYARLYLRKVKARLEEQCKGSYDMQKIVGSLSRSNGRPDIASFDRHVEVRASPGAGRGLFATRKFRQNEIIMCEKAFCVVWSYEREAFSALAVDVREDALIRVFPAGLHKAVVQKLLNNPSLAEKVLDLFGDYTGLGKNLIECDGSPVVDTFQIHDIVQRNAFGPGQQTEHEDATTASTGLWIKASYINHSCVPNAKKDYVGDLMILRAAHPIAEGEEITQSYDESRDHDARTSSLFRTWGFKCRCMLCIAEEADGPAVREKRRELGQKVDVFLKSENAPLAGRVVINKAKRLLHALEDTYDKDRYRDVRRPALFELEEWLRTAKRR